MILWTWDGQGYPVQNQRHFPFPIEGGRSSGPVLKTREKYGDFVDSCLARQTLHL